MAKGSAPKKNSAKKASTTTATKVKKPKDTIIKKVFEGCGFRHIHSDNIHFEINSRRGEIDHIFVYENVVVLCEETVQQDVSSHFGNKKLFHELISQSRTEFLSVYRKLNQDFLDYLEKSDFLDEEYEFRHIYFSGHKEADEGLMLNSSILRIMQIQDANYFDQLGKIIGSSARYEMLKYLKIELKDIGDRRKNGGSGTPFNDFSAFVLPSSQTNYPPGFGIVSFYADPASLIRRAYVMRKDGWTQPEVSYQRFLKRTKITSMRNYLAQNKRVYINNLIVTLPSESEIRDPTTKANVALTGLTKICDAKISIPDELGTIGVIDGQHRIFSYHEGRDGYESTIKKYRERQNLLVTGLIFPNHYDEAQRAKFEAELFLAINDTQASVRSDLKQEIEAIVNPLSPIALAKSIIAGLSKDGPLAGKLQRNLYDGSARMKTGSIVRYVLVPMMKAPRSSTRKDTLIAVWGETVGKAQLSSDVDKASFVAFSVLQINRLLMGAMKNVRPGMWNLSGAKGDGILNPTTVGGFLLCLKDILASGIDITRIDYEKDFKNLGDFRFDGYRSSRWSELGKALSKTYVLL